MADNIPSFTSTRTPRPLSVPLPPKPAMLPQMQVVALRKPNVQPLPTDGEAKVAEANAWNDLAQTIVKVGAEIIEFKQDEKDSAFLASASTQLRANQAVAFTKQMHNAESGAFNFTEDFLGGFDRELERLRKKAHQDGVSSQALQDLELKAATTRAQFETKGMAFEFTARAEHYKAQTEGETSLAAASLLHDPSPENYAKQQADLFEKLNGPHLTNNLKPAELDQLRVTKPAELGEAYIKGMILRGGDDLVRAAETLTSGKMDGVLEADKQATLLDTIRVRADQEEREAISELNSRVADSLARSEVLGTRSPELIQGFLDAGDDDRAEEYRQLENVAIAAWDFGERAKFLPAAEQNALLKTLAPSASTPHKAFSETVQAYQSARSKLAAMQEAREEDPAGYNMQDPGVSSAFRTGVKINNFSRYAALTRESQTAQGIQKADQRLLADGAGEALNTTAKSIPYEQRAEFYRAEFRKWPGEGQQIFKELVDAGMDDTIQLALAVNHPQVDTLLAQAHEVGKKELVAALPNSTDKADIQNKVSEYSEPFREMLYNAHKGGLNVAIGRRMEDAVALLAMAKVHDSDMNASSAAEWASRLVFDNMTIEETFYIPHRLPDGDVSPADVKSELSYMQSPGYLREAGMPAFGTQGPLKDMPDELLTESINDVAREGVWLNTADGAGVYLAMDMGVYGMLKVRDGNGDPIYYDFIKGIELPSGWSASGNPRYKRSQQILGSQSDAR